MSSGCFSLRAGCVQLFTHFQVYDLVLYLRFLSFLDWTLDASKTKGRMLPFPAARTGPGARTRHGPSHLPLFSKQEQQQAVSTLPCAHMQGLVPALVMVANPTLQYMLYEWLTARVLGWRRTTRNAAAATAAARRCVMRVCGSSGSSRSRSGSSGSSGGGSSSSGDGICMCLCLWVAAYADMAHGCACR